MSFDEQWFLICMKPVLFLLLMLLVFWMLNLRIYHHIKGHKDLPYSFF